MSTDDIYNPLDKRHLADSIARAFFDRPIHPLPPKDPFKGAGIYAIYYEGAHSLYRDIAESFLAQRSGEVGQRPIPIYIGKSDAPGSRKGVSVGSSHPASQDPSGEVTELKDAEEFLTNKPQHRKLYNRLVKHSKSIAATTNLSLDDFSCRYMLVDEIWVPLGEARLLEMFRPLWNVLIEGFGSNVEGKGRTNTARPVWDILHPGRKENLGLRVAKTVEKGVIDALRSAATPEALERAIDVHRKARIAFNRSLKDKEGNAEI